MKGLRLQHPSLSYGVSPQVSQRVASLSLGLCGTFPVNIFTDPRGKRAEASLGCPCSGQWSLWKRQPGHHPRSPRPLQTQRRVEKGSDLWVGLRVSRACRLVPSAAPAPQVKLCFLTLKFL